MRTEKTSQEQFLQPSDLLAFNVRNSGWNPRATSLMVSAVPFAHTTDEQRGHFTAAAGGSEPASVL